MSKFVFSWFDGKYVIFCKDIGKSIKFCRDSLELVETDEFIIVVSGRAAFVRRQGLKTLMPRQRKLNGGRDLAPLDEEPFIIPDGINIGDEIDSSKLRFRNKYKVKKPDIDESVLKNVPILCYDPRVLAMSSACIDIDNCDPDTLERLGSGETEWDKRFSILKRLNPSKEAAIEYLEKNRYTYKRPITRKEEWEKITEDRGWSKQTLGIGDITPLLEELERQERQEGR